MLVALDIIRFIYDEALRKKTINGNAVMGEAEIRRIVQNCHKILNDNYKVIARIN